MFIKLLRIEAHEKLQKNWLEFDWHFSWVVFIDTLHMGQFTGAKTSQRLTLYLMKGLE